MRYGVIVLLTQRNIALAEIIVRIRTKQVELSRGSSAFTHRLISGLLIKVTQAAHPCVYDIRDRGIAFHRKGLTSVKLPFR